MFNVEMCQDMSRCPMITPYVHCWWGPKIDCYNFGSIWPHSPLAISCQDPPQPSSVKPPQAGKDTDLSGRWWERLYGRIWQIGQNVSVLIVTGWGTATMHIWWRAGPNPIILHFSCLGLSLVIYNKIYLKYSQTCSIYLMISSDILRDLMNCLVMFRVEMWCVKICQDAPHMSIVCETPR